MEPSLAAVVYTIGPWTLGSLLLTFAQGAGWILPEEMFDESDRFAAISLWPFLLGWYVIKAPFAFAHWLGRRLNN